LLALSALSVALPAGAQGGMSEADAIKQAETFRLQRRNQQAVDLLLPYTATSKNADLFRQIGRSQRELRTPADCKKAVEWFTKAIEINSKSSTYYADRSGAYDCLDKDFQVQRMNDRAKVVEILEAASPTKTATAGAYADLGNAISSVSAPSGGEFVDRPGMERAAEYLQKAIGLDNSSIGIRRDLAGITRDRLRNFGGAFDLLWEAYGLEKTRDQSTLQNNRSRGVTTRLLTTAPSGASITDLWLQGRYDGMTGAEATARANARIAGLRNESIEYYQKFINAFEGKAASEGLPAAFSDTRFGAGSLDIAGAYADQSTVYIAQGSFQFGKALDNYKRRTQLEPREPDYWWDLANHAGNRQNDLATAGQALEQFLRLTNGHTHNSQPAARALLTRVCTADTGHAACKL
jgi:tetratricopeptide (TPR) repeat protein